MMSSVSSQIVMFLRGYKPHTDPHTLLQQRTVENEEEEEKEASLCWGYEKDCTEETRLFVPRCEEPAKPWSKTMEEKHDTFWTQGDFGYVKQEIDSIMQLCYPRQGSKNFKKQIENVRQKKCSV